MRTNLSTKITSKGQKAGSQVYLLFRGSTVWRDGVSCGSALVNIYIPVVIKCK